MNRRALALRLCWPLLLGLFSLSGTASSMTDSDEKQRIEKMIIEFESSFNVPQVDVASAQRLVAKQGFLLLDVREPKESHVSMLPGAISLAQFEANPAAFKDQKIIAYCTIGYRSGKFAQHWNERGFHISNLRGSLLLWAHANGPLVDANRKPTHKIHVYGAKWDLLPAHYQSVY
jgi:rhodanese-related sulfurtransferase